MQDLGFLVGLIVVCYKAVMGFVGNSGSGGSHLGL